MYPSNSAVCLNVWVCVVCRSSANYGMLSIKPEPHVDAKILSLVAQLHLTGGITPSTVKMLRVHDISLLSSNQNG